MIGLIASCAPNGFELSGQGHDHSVSIPCASLVRCSEWLCRQLISLQWMANSYVNSVAQASPKPSVIFCQKSAGVQPSSPNPIIIFDIIPGIMLDIILGIPLLAINTTIPPISAPIDPISMYFILSRFCAACMIFSLYLLAMEAVKMNYSLRLFGGITLRFSGGA